MCNLYFNCKKQFPCRYVVLQANLTRTEVARAICKHAAILGVPAAALLNCQVPLQKQQLAQNEHGITRGSGPGGAGGTRKCGRCVRHIGKTVLYAGHDCLLYVISIGKDPRQYPHTKEAAAHMLSLPTAEQAQQMLADKKAKSVQSWTNGKRKRKLSSMSCPYP